MEKIMTRWYFNHKVNLPAGIETPEPPKTARVKLNEAVREMRANWLWALQNMVAGMRQTSNDAICALYIIHSLGLAEITDDFKPKGASWVDSEKLQRLLYILEDKDLPAHLKGKVIKKSYPYQLGMIFKDLSQRELWKGALSIAYKNSETKWWIKKIGEDDQEMDKKVAEAALEKIHRRVARLKKKFKIV